MQSVPKKIFQILDGTPAVYGQYSRGQSLAELALVTPLLIVLLMGLAEIGWFANNYLILLETTRVGARYGAVQTGDFAPDKWDNSASLLPNLQADYVANAAGGPLTQNARAYRICTNSEAGGTPRFYNIIICKMFDAMSPLDFRGEYKVTNADPTDRNSVDEIVVSAFSLLSINPTDSNIPAAMRSTIDLAPNVPSTQQQVLVIGRYPTNANECTTDASDPDPRDPFNYISYTGASNTDTTSPGNTGTRNFVMSSGTQLFSELLGYDTGPELQRGFALTGQHIITATRTLPAASRCYGSEWTIRRVQDLINVANYGMQNQNQRSMLPSQGLILVEMFWQHTLLLRNPVFNPVFNILNDPSNPNGGGTVISVWAAFPLPTTEPKIKFAVGS
ncbi:MAG: hypothetical protein GC179_14625 [Anaerolineaceae bacterium]|nr:hypothetical protein [Anaerolineaceae bacterium]